MIIGILPILYILLVLGMCELVVYTLLFFIKLPNRAIVALDIYISNNKKG